MGAGRMLHERRSALAALALLASALAMAAGRDLMQFTNQYAGGGLDWNGDQGVYGAGKVNVCAFPKGSLQNPDPFQEKVFLDVLAVTATAILSESDVGSFIAPPRGFYHYGPGCVLYNYVCDFSSSDPCNLHGVCQSNNTCYCGNGYKTCFTNSGSTNDATTGCETNIFDDVNNCGGCFLGCPTGFPYCVGGVCSTTPNTTRHH